MTRASTVAAVANYLTYGQIPFLTTVKPYPAKVNPEGEFDLGANQGTGAVIFMFLPNQREKRINPGGAAVFPLAPITGRKWREYQVTLMCFLRSTKQQAEDAGADMDTFLDGLVAHLEADRRFGTTGQGPPTEIFQAGEGSDTGGDDITIESSLPRLLLNQVTQTFAAVKVTVCEVLFT